MHTFETGSFPFQGFPFVETRSLSRAGSEVSREISSHRFYCATQADLADAKITCLRLNRTRLFGVHLGSNVLAQGPPSPSLQMVVPLTGEVMGRRGNQQHVVKPGSALVSPPGAAVDVFWASNCTGVSIWLEVSALKAMLNLFFGSDSLADITFVPTIDLTHGSGLTIADALHGIMAESADSESLFSRGIITRQYEELLITGIIHNVVARRKEESRAASLHYAPSLSRALDYIDVHLREEIRARDLSAAAGVSIRSLQYQFARQLGLGPMAYVRREKLRRIREELFRARPDQTTVADIAATWAFYDPKYFSRIYKRTFGECPSESLKRKH